MPGSRATSLHNKKLINLLIKEDIYHQIKVPQHVQEVCNLNQMSKVAKLASNGTN